MALRSQVVIPHMLEPIEFHYTIDTETGARSLRGCRRLSDGKAITGPDAQALWTRMRRLGAVYARAAAAIDQVLGADGRGERIFAIRSRALMVGARVVIGLPADLAEALGDDVTTAVMETSGREVADGELAVLWSER